MATRTRDLSAYVADLTTRFLDGEESYCDETLAGLCHWEVAFVATRVYGSLITLGGEEGCEAAIRWDGFLRRLATGGEDD